MSKFGIDVSEHQGNINWDETKKHIDFAILRLGWIGNHNNHTLDSKFERNYSECKRLGIPVGVYIYCYSSSEDTAKSGANWSIEKLQGKQLDLPVYIDMEDNSIVGLGMNNLTNICIAFNEIIEKNGYRAGVYANRNWFDNYLDKNVLKSKYSCWIAHYTSGDNKYEGEYDIWQNSSSGLINGVNGNTDTNFMYKDLIQTSGNVQTNTIEGSTLELAYKVMKGEFGDGDVRISNLGSRYNEIQNFINHIASSNAETLAKEILEGKYGNGEIRETVLGEKYSEAQKIINSQSKQTRIRTYKVRGGDTLSTIAAKYGTTYQELARKNNLSDPNKIYPNQVLKI